MSIPTRSGIVTHPAAPHVAAWHWQAWNEFPLASHTRVPWLLSGQTHGAVCPGVQVSAGWQAPDVQNSPSRQSALVLQGVHAASATLATNPRANAIRHRVIAPPALVRPYW